MAVDKQRLEGTTITRSGCTVLIRDTKEDETGCRAQVVELPGCYTQGEPIDAERKNAQDAIERRLQVFRVPPVGKTAADWP